MSLSGVFLAAALATASPPDLATLSTLVGDGRCPNDLTSVAVAESVIEFDSDGRTIHALKFEGPTQGRAPAVVLLHGAGGLGMDGQRLRRFALRLAQQGYVALIPNYYDATGGAPADFTEARMKRWRRVPRDAVAYLQALPNVDPARIATFGFSRGGYLAVDGAISTPGVLAGVGVVAGLNVGPAGEASQRPQILLIHPESDVVVPAKSVEALERHLRREGVPVENVTLPGSGHAMAGELWCAATERSLSLFHERLSVGAP